MIKSINTIILGILLLGGVVLLQVLLSKSNSKLPGLILPGMSFLISCLIPLCMMMPSGAEAGSFGVMMLLAWLMCNIPTLVLLAIYFACRDKNRLGKEMDKMNIQDLD